MSENIGQGTGSGGSSAAEKARMSYAQARDAAKEAMGQVRERASAYYQQGREKAADYSHKLEEMVREQPMKSILIATGAGLLLGILLKRR